ncbi:MAG TPA: universal stress protein [Candidatus Aveggerthella stercoripullorum]|jgi:nucleotide-binding universal stress UspA family protein|uniref:Universal stress protein n=1 Tax=Candidatus Aveggerthella stercoripullorum TaxID=2840688 RepID=A0A9D1A138_9ACTN|nr:universal stress protein [Slackia piriformis]HIR00956.1 universal stress protein [Candidatus Aveggerthella stercoripullorum]
MAYRNILVPYDQSESARHALLAAFEAAGHAKDARVTALFVAPTPEFESGSFMVAAQVSGVLPLSAKDQKDMLDAYLDHKREEVTADLDDLLKEEDAELGLAISHGKPSKVICDYVDTHDVDLVVMGCRGLDAVRGMIGSVSAAVLRSVDCPVLVVK